MNEPKTHTHAEVTAILNDVFAQVEREVAERRQHGRFLALRRLEGSSWASFDLSVDVHSIGVDADPDVPGWHYRKRPGRRHTHLLIRLPDRLADVLSYLYEPRWLPLRDWVFPRTKRA